MVAGAVLTAALALVALPGVAGSQTLDPDRPIEAAAFQSVLTTSRSGDRTMEIRPLSAARRSAGFLATDDVFVEPGEELAAPPTRPSVGQPASAVHSALKPPRSTLSGYASFYDNGTTAMRLPRGTLVIICASGGCVQRIVNDYGPNAAIHPDRIADLYRPDFFAICGCPSFSGTTWVTVRVY